MWETPEGQSTIEVGVRKPAVVVDAGQGKEDVIAAVVKLAGFGQQHNSVPVPQALP